MFKVNIVGTQKLVIFLERKAAKKPSKVTVNVGYTAPYAVFVHEDLTKHHPQGQAKFLEQPLKTERKRLEKEFEETFDRTQSVLEANLAAGRLLLEESKKLVPVDTGKLKKSGRVLVPKRGG